MKHTDLAILSLGLLLVISSFKSSSEARSVNLAPPQCHPNVIGNCNKKCNNCNKRSNNCSENCNNQQFYTTFIGTMPIAMNLYGF